MNLQRSIEELLVKILIGAVKTPMVVRRMFIALGRKIMFPWRAFVSEKGSQRGGTDDGSEGVGVPAPLRPRPPMLSAAATKALPELGEDPV
jgi:hypothetical protein